MGRTRAAGATALRDELCAAARARGFAAAGVATPAPFRLARRRCLDAIAAGRMDGMPWMHERRIRAATDLGRRYPWARSVLALAWPYAPTTQPGAPPAPAPSRPGRPHGRVAAYACLDGGADYHDVLGGACDDLVAWLRGRLPGLRAKRFVDHGWAVDRAVAERAGLGFCGRNSCLITPEAGSYVLLAEIVLDIDLPPTPRSRRSCGRCTACMPACPTGAITGPGVVDSRRCISYLTIEHEGPIPLELRPLVGTWAFGCDLCQEACPINMRRAPAPGVRGAAAQRGPVPFPDLVDLLTLDERGFAARFRGTSLWRSGRGRLARNAAVALGNAGDRDAVLPLERARDTDPDPTVREAAAWAVERLAPSLPSGA